MPKQKTRKCVAKRVKQTGTGKFQRKRAGARHILTKKSGKRKRRLGSDAGLSAGDTRRVKAALPYGV